ncbi:17446_t:CDS:2 [Rhizophagus irregularis]|nr:17446_t:CDS:2 [Rhizophagus irregularis]
MPPTSSSDTSSSDTSANAIISTNKSKLAKTQLKVLPLHDNEFIQIQRYFLKGLPHARIHTIIKLQMPTKLVEAHEQYKKTLLNNPSYGSNMTTNNLISSMKSNNNLDKHTNTMFHGTKISCNPQRFINGNSNFCLFSCGMCGIIQNGNQGKYSRFNGRMWFANNSAISLGYCGLSTSRTMFNCTPFSSKNSLMAMFVVDVVSLQTSDIIIVDVDADLYVNAFPVEIDSTRALIELIEESHYGPNDPAYNGCTKQRILTIQTDLNNTYWSGNEKPTKLAIMSNQYIFSMQLPIVKS